MSDPATSSEGTDGPARAVSTVTTKRAATFGEMMTLEPHGADTFVGTGPEYPWGGLYGGQIVAQGLRAAGLTVDPEFRPHSLHAYFVRRGDSTEPIRFEVERVRNGRSFVTRSLEARQSAGAILTMTASFQVDEEAHDLQASTKPDVAAPSTITDSGWSPVFERRFVDAAAEGCARAWVRTVEDLGDDPLLNACALAYASDDLPTDALVTLHPNLGWDADAEEGTPGTGDRSFMAASLDHAIWFHRPARADRWQLQDFQSESAAGSRGVSIGRFYDETGVHVATVAQEVLLRTRRRS